MKPTAPRVRMQSVAQIGEVIGIRTKIRHPMETGWRKGGDGQAVPRNLITRFVCTFEGEDVLSADFDSGVAQDPYLFFYTKVTGPGTYRFTWQADNGETYTTSSVLTIATA